MRARYVLSSVITSLLLFPALTCAQDLWFLQMSDPQLGMYANNENFIQETANFEFAIANANRLKPRFVVICGDLINKGADPAQLAEFHRIAAKLDPGIDLRLVAGNHDVGNAPTEASLEAYRRAIGKDYYTFEYPGFEGIVLNSSLIQHPEGSPADAARQEDWLRAELARAQQARVPSVVIFQHVPLFVKSAGEPDGYFNIPQTTRTKYLELLRSSGVRYVFAGHTHYAVSGEAPSLHIFTAGPVGKPLSGGASGFGLAHLHGSELQYQYFDFGHIPNTLETAFTVAAKPAPVH